MKKIIILTLLFVFVLGCSQRAEIPESQPTSESQGAAQPEIQKGPCMNYDSGRTSNANAVCCSGSVLTQSLDPLTGQVVGFGCCPTNTCHQYSESQFGNMAACSVHGVVISGKLNNAPMDYYLVCNTNRWEPVDCSIADCKQFDTTLSKIDVNNPRIVQACASLPECAAELSMSYGS